MEGKENKGRDEIFSRVVRAGKRTYFLDVKATRRDDYYLTITESKKRYDNDGNFRYEKHKVFLYKEDFDKFTDALTDVIQFIKEHKGDEMPPPRHTDKNEPQNIEDLNFEDLG